MYKVIITDNNTDKSYFFKTQHSTDYTSMWSITSKIVEKEKQYHDIDIPLGEVNLKQYLNAVYNINVECFPMDGRKRYARNLTLFNWWQPFELAWQDIKDNVLK